MARVCHVSSVHIISDPRIYLKQCAALAKAGHEVVVLACSREEKQAFHGYRIISVGEPTRNRWRRILYQLRIWKLVRMLNPEIIHFHDPELLILMWLIAGLRGQSRKVIFDVHEDQRTLFGRGGKAGMTQKTLQKLYMKLFAMAEQRMTLILAEDSYQEFCQRPHVVVHNYGLATEPIPWTQRSNRIIYLGEIAEVYGALNMVRGFAQSGLKDWELMLIGRCNEHGLVETMYVEADRLGVRSLLRISGYFPLEDAMEYVRRSRLGLALLHPVQNIVRSLPTKVFDYLSAEVPVLLSNFPYYQEFFKGVGSISFVDPMDSSLIGASLRELVERLPQLEDHCRQGRQYFLDRFSWEAEKEKLISLYEQLLVSQPPG